MQTVEKLAERYSASTKSAAIHYVTLAKVLCALLWLQRDYKEHDLEAPDYRLKVRYQVSSDGFPFRIKHGTAVSLENELLWHCFQEEFSTAGVIKGEHLGLEKGIDLWIDCFPYDHIGTVIALVYPRNKEPLFVIDDSKSM
jgi:hypothetical protein